MKRAVLTTLAVSLAIAMTWLYTRGGSATDAAPAAVEPDVSAGSNDPNHAGYWVQIDSQTGRIVAPTEAPETMHYPTDLQNALSTSSEGLEEVEAPSGGGKMVNLQGRFQHTYGATVGEDGVLKAACDLPQSNAETSSDEEE